jgi:ribosomal protein S18 acetylase RimI-like enzyme
MAAATMSALRAPAPAPSVGDHRRSRSVIARVRRVRRVRESVSKASIDRRSISRRVSPPSLTRRLLPLSSQAAPARPNFRVNLGKGTVSVEDPREEAAKRALAAATAGNVTGRPAESVRPRDVKLKDNGNVSIAAMTEEDCVDATKLIMELFFKVRPQDFLAKDRLKAEQAERVYGGLVQGVVESEDRLLLAAKVGGKLVGVAEVSLPGGARFGSEKFEPKAPADAPYVSDVAVAPNQRGRGIGKSLLRACEAAVVAKGCAAMYLHTKVDNDDALALFEKGGYAEPADAKAGLTQMQIAQRGTKGGPLASLGLVEVGHVLLKKELRASDYN